MSRPMSEEFLDPNIVINVKKLFPKLQHFHEIYLSHKMSIASLYRAMRLTGVHEDTEAAISTAYGDMIMLLKTTTEELLTLPSGDSANDLDYITSIVDDYPDLILPFLRNRAKLAAFRIKAATYDPNYGT